MLLRTLDRPTALSSSAFLLHEDAALRLAFATPEQRHTFARAWLALASAE